MNISLKKVFGPPGTGKTTWLIDYMKQSGIPFERIAFVSFAKSTILEIKSRLNLSKTEAQYFRTIHSMNFYLLGLDKKQVANSYLHTFPAKFSAKFLEQLERGDDGIVPMAYDTIDDNFYNQMMKDRRELRPLDYVPPQYLSHAALYLDFKNKYRRWLEENDYIDFEGMLERGIVEEKVPPVDLLCVDEWQDLSPLQVKQVTFWSQHIPVSVHAGDDDQTIHAWAGARHEDFINFPTFTPQEKEVVVLNKTYRLPTRVLDMSVNFIKKNKNRIDKQFVSANDIPGRIGYSHIDKVADVLKEELKKGTCKLLVRNRALIPYLVGDLTKRGVPTSNLLQKTVKAIAIIMESKPYLTIDELVLIASESTFPSRLFFEKGAKKELLNVAEKFARQERQMIPLNELLQYGVKETFIEALKNKDISQLHSKNLDKAFDVYKQFGKSFRTVEIQTIHQSKGAEADTVVISLDVTKRTERESRLPDRIEEERRVWYVAMTRAKKNLLFLEPTYQYFYRSPLTDYVKLYLNHI